MFYENKNKSFDIIFKLRKSVPLYEVGVQNFVGTLHFFLYCC